MIIIYGVCVAISILIYLWLCITDVKKSLCQNIMILIMTLSNIGYLSLGVSKDISSAILSVKIVYLGGCFFPLLYFFTVCEVCHISLKKSLMISFIVFQIIIYSFVCSIGYSNLYYKNVQFEVIEGVGHLTKEYGSLHIVYPFSLYGYLFVSIVVAIWACKEKKTVNHKEIRNMILCSSIAVLCYVMQKVFNLEMDIMFISYLVLMLGTLVPIYHSNMYTVNENKDIIHEQLNKVGFITFNGKMEYMGANEFALAIFDELRDCKVGDRILTPGSELKKQIANIEGFRENTQDERGHRHSGDMKFTKNNRTFHTEIHTLNDFRNKCVGYTLEITDETEHYHMLGLKERYNEELTKEVELKTEKIRTIQEKTILGMAQMVESRDLSTGGHIKRTSDVVRIFAKKLSELDMGFNQHFLQLVVRSAPMHDLGKIGVDDAVLRKQGKFTDEEYEKMKKHAEIGGEMVHDILTSVEEDEFVQVAFNVANYHHEKVNGKGYPCGLKGEEIPVEARIMALADVFDALVSKRCYKEAFSYDKAFSIIEKDAGEHFDKKLAEVFLQCRGELEAYYNNSNL